MGFLSQLFSPKKDEVQNSPLVEAMHLAAQKPSPMRIRTVHELLLESDLIIPTAPASGNVNENGWQNTDHELAIPMVTQRTEQGELSVLVFTDQDSLATWRQQGCAYVALKGPEVFAMAQRAGATRVVINPSGPAGGVIHQAQIATLAEGLVGESLDRGCARKVAPMDTVMRMRAPQGKVDPAFVERARIALSRYDSVSAGYLVEIAIGQGEPHLAIGVEWAEPMPPQSLDQVMRDMLAAVKYAVPPDTFFDLIPLKPGSTLELAREKGAVILQRKN